MTYIYVGELTIIGSDNGLSPGRRQAIIRTNAGILLIEPLGTNFSEILIGIQRFSFKKMLLKMSSAKWRPFCRGLNVLKNFEGKMAHTKPQQNTANLASNKEVLGLCVNLAARDLLIFFFSLWFSSIIFSLINRVWVDRRNYVFHSV